MATYRNRYATDRNIAQIRTAIRSILRK